MEDIQLRKTLFWDTNMEDIDLKKNRDFIISRTLLFGDMNDFRNIKKLYGLRRIIKTAKKSRSLDKRTANFLSLVYHIPRNKFLCLKKS